MAWGWTRWLIDPALLADASDDLDEMDNAREMYKDNGHLKVFADYDDSRERRSELAFLTKPMAGFWSPFYLPMFERHFRVLAESRMAATAIAIKLYELDHGHRPDTLDTLVPDYLPVVPDDPFLGRRHPVQYRPEGVTPELTQYFDTAEEHEAATATLDLRPLALLYCVGTDLVDHGCPLWVDDLRRLDTPNGYRSREDRYFLLDAAPPTLAESILPPHLREPDFGSHWDDTLDDDDADASDQPEQNDDVDHQGWDEHEQDSGGEQP